MKKTADIICAALLTVLFPFFCISSSFDPHAGQYFFGYFGPHPFSFTLIRYLIISAVILVLTYLNRNNSKVFTLYVPLSFLIVYALIICDYFFTHHLLYNYSYCLWLCAAVSVAEAALFIGATLFLKTDYKAFYKIFWREYLPIFMFVVFLAFIRKPDSFEFSVNITPGHGTFRFFSYILRNPNDSYMMLICLGNIFILSPLPFILKGISFKIPNGVILIIGLLFPLLIEAYQYVFRCGNVDIDDIILNWSGFILGLIMLKIVYDRKIKEAA